MSRKVDNPNPGWKPYQVNCRFKAVTIDICAEHPGHDAVNMFDRDINCAKAVPSTCLGRRCSLVATIIS